MPGGPHPGLGEHPADVSPFQTNVMTRSALVALITTARYASATTTRKLLKKEKKKGLFLIRLGNYTAHLGPHGKVTGGERPPGPGFCFHEGQG